MWCQEYTIEDLNHAVTIGYIVKTFFEIFQFKEKKPIFKKFFQVLFSKKIKVGPNI